MLQVGAKAKDEHFSCFHSSCQWGLTVKALLWTDMVLTIGAPWESKLNKNDTILQPSWSDNGF